MHVEPSVVGAIVGGLLALIGVAGIIVPVLPGSILIGLGLLGWAVGAGTVWGWATFVVGLVFVLLGMVSGWLLTGRGLKKREIPSRSITIGIVAGIVGIFVLPAFGLPIGFALGLVAAEYARVKDLGKALESSWAALKAMGVGMLVELLCGLTATTILAASIAAHFIWIAPLGAQ